MHRILAATVIAPGVKRFRVEAPRVAAHWRPGQFVIVRPMEHSERIPLTIVEGDATGGWVGLVVQEAGKTTHDLDRLDVGGDLHDVAGPLGRPSRIERFGTVVAVGGGVGTAVVFPVVAALCAAGNAVTAVVGARSADLVILASELEEVGSNVVVVTDDGSIGERGLVSDALGRMLADGASVDRVFAAGPIPMMRAVAETTRPYRIPTVASLNPIMVDGTGMCGGCRVLVGGETRFACVDGPEFDAHAVDFDLLARRNRTYAEFEQARRDACAGAASP